MMNPGARFDYSFKFILVGDVAVGKTSVIGRFVDGRFDPYH
jgi:GTPase SAR1 family protein